MSCSDERLEGCTGNTIGHSRTNPSTPARPAEPGRAGSGQRLRDVFYKIEHVYGTRTESASLNAIDEYLRPPGKQGQ